MTDQLLLIELINDENRYYNIMKSVKKLIVEHQVFIDLFVLNKRSQPGGQLLDILECDPMLVQLFVHAIHVGYYTLGL